MTLIAKQPYYKIIRELSSVRQRDIKEEREIKLYIDKVVTRYREFPIEDVLDMSYRNFGVKGGLLYLHTIKGVFSYHVERSPEQFIRVFKDYIEGL